MKLGYKICETSLNIMFTHAEDVCFFKGSRAGTQDSKLLIPRLLKNL